MAAAEKGGLRMLGRPLFAGVPLIEGLDTSVRRAISAQYAELCKAGAPLSKLQLRRRFAGAQATDRLEVDWSSVGKGTIELGEAGKHRASLAVPYCGNAHLWRLATRWAVSRRHPRGDVRPRALMLEVEYPAHKQDFLPVLFSEEVELIRGHLDAQRADLDEYNQRFDSHVRRLVEEEWPRLGQ